MKSCFAKFDFCRYKDYKNKIIFFSKSNVLKNALIQFSLVFPVYVSWSQQKTHFSCYFLFCELLNLPITKKQKKQRNSLWMTQLQKLIPQNSLFLDMSIVKICSAKIYAPTEYDFYYCYTQSMYFKLGFSKN